MWGNADITKEITINDHPHQIRENLWDFFCEANRSSRQSKCAMALWIDAICIEQSSTSERNHQVSIMGDIYSKATLVISWLGRATGRVAVAMNWLVDFIQLRPLGLNPSIRESAEFNWWHLIYSHGYWERVWIIQEVVLAQALHVWCGEGSITLDDLVWTKNWMTADRLGMHSPAMEIIDMRALRLDPTYNDWWKQPVGVLDDHFYHLVTMTQIAQCSDPRDRIFAILSILGPEQRDQLDITPDYDKDSLSLLVELYDKLGSAHVLDSEGRYRNLLCGALHIDILDFCEVLENSQNQIGARKRRK